MADKPARGLADVVAASTALSDIDGHAGRLSYRGYDINELTGNATFEEAAGDDTYYRMSRRMEEVVFAEKGLCPNVDFYAATVYHYLGIPTDLFTPVFSASRMAGWTAHVIEQHEDNRLIRPDSEYIGESGLSWVPLGAR